MASTPAQQLEKIAKQNGMQVIFNTTYELFLHIEFILLIRYLASNELSMILNNFQVSSMEFAKYMDSVDPLKDFRKKFDYPKRKTLPVDTKGKVRREFIYLCHNIIENVVLRSKSISLMNFRCTKGRTGRGMYLHGRKFSGHTTETSRILYEFSNESVERSVSE